MSEHLELIQGKKPDSKEEVWAAHGLYKFRIPFIFQYAVAGGLRIRRGMVIDFLVTHPVLIPFEVYSDYWHEDELPGGDLIRLKAIEEYFATKPLILWGKDAPNEAAVHRWIGRKIAR